MLTKISLLTFVCLICVAFGEEHADVTDLTKDSITREKILKEIRAHLVPNSTRRQAVSADGEMKEIKQWVFFHGAKTDTKNVLSSVRTAALFIKTGDGQWVMLECTTDFKDDLLQTWLQKYALSPRIFEPSGYGN